MMYVPKGFGHGFITLTDDTEAFVKDGVTVKAGTTTPADGDFDVPSPSL